MAKMNGHVYLTKAQIERMRRGRYVRIVREGKAIILGLKPSARKKKIAKLEAQLEATKAQLAAARKAAK